jgi:hypothetical protein
MAALRIGVFSCHGSTNLPGRLTPEIGADRGHSKPKIPDSIETFAQKEKISSHRHPESKNWKIP